MVPSLPYSALPQQTARNHHAHRLLFLDFGEIDMWDNPHACMIHSERSISMVYESKPWLAHYDPGISHEIDIPKVTLKDLIEQTASEYPDRPAFHFFDATWSFGMLSEYGDRFARALDEHGLQKGDVLGINLVNSPQYLIAVIGALKAGVIISGVSPLNTANEMAYQLSDLDAKAVLTMDYLFEERLAGVVGDLGNLDIIIVTSLFDFVQETCQPQKVYNMANKAIFSLKELVSHSPADPPRADITTDDVCFIQYTGGTTGSPKGAVLSHANVVANITQLGGWFKTERGKEVILYGFPMFHIAGLLHAVHSLAFAMTLVLISNPRDTEHIIRELARYHPTFMANVPSLYLMLLQEQDFHKLDFSGLQICMCGAAPFPVEKVKELEGVVGSNKLSEAYGMTETGPLLTANPKEGLKKAGSAGIPLPSTRLKLVDLNMGLIEVPIGEEGEIIASGPQVMRGYHKKPEETDYALREHNGEYWMHTGDVAIMDEDGFFFIVDRAKDMINVAGYKVFSSEVEHVLSEHPAIELCALVGIPDPERPGSESVKLVVQKKQSYQDVPKNHIREELIAFARENLAAYKIPKVIEFVESMPLTSVGKVDKKVLRQARP